MYPSSFRPVTVELISRLTHVVRPPGSTCWNYTLESGQASTSVRRYWMTNGQASAVRLTRPRILLSTTAMRGSMFS
jgi:hypothetical protein